MNKRKPVFVGLFLFSFACLATLYSLVTPAFEAPDEVGHFYYISHLIRTHTLPHQIDSNSGEAHQPPLYYLIASLGASLGDVNDEGGAFHFNPSFTAGIPGPNINVGLHGSADKFPYEGQALALHLTRIVSVLMGAATIALILLFGWMIFPQQPGVGWLAAILAAFNPQFLFISGSINNDNLLILLSTLAWIQALRTYHEPKKEGNWLLLGLLAAAGLLTKLNGLLIGAIAGLVLVIISLREKSLKRFLVGATEIALPVVLISGWWFLRNQQLYGDPLGWNIYSGIYAANERQIPIALNELTEIIKTQYHSFWGVFGWMNLFAPGWFFQIIKAILVISLAGWIISVLKRWFKRLSDQQQQAIAWLIVIVVAQELLMFFIIMNCNASCYQGRYLFPAIGPIMILLSLGIFHLFGRYAKVFLPILVVLLIFSAIYIPLRVIQPAYDLTTLSTMELREVPDLPVDFDQSFYTIRLDPDIKRSAAPVQ